MGGTGGCGTVRGPEDGRNADLGALMEYFPAKTKERGGSARASPVAAPTLKSDSH